MTKLECQQIFAMLSEYLDRELPPDLCETIDTHIAGCPPCVEFVKSLEKTVAYCRGAGPGPTLPRPLSAEKLEELRDRLKVHARSELIVSTSMDVLKEAQLILTVTSAIHDVIRPEHLQPGSVVCDVARPRDVSAMVAAVRDDILVIDGGMVDVPGPVNFHFNFGFPPGKAYACMAETIALALEGRFEDYTLGKHLTR